MMSIKKDQILWLIIYWKSTESGANNEIKQNIILVKELPKPIITNFEKKKNYSRFIDNIWSNDLADINLISKFNKVQQIMKENLLLLKDLLEH